MTIRRGQIIARGPTTWLVRAFVGRDGAGKRRYSNKTVHGSRRAADRALTAMLSAKDRGVATVTPGRMTVSAFLDEWLAGIRQSVSSRTVSDYERALASHIRPQLGSVRLANLRRADIQRVVNGLTDREFAPDSVRLSVAPLRAALNVAVEQGLLVATPFRGVKLPKKRSVERQVFTAEQAARFLTACDTDETYGPLFVIAFMCALRPSELVALRWADLDGDVLRVSRSLKTVGSRRAINLSAVELDALRRQRRIQAEQRLAVGPDWRDEAGLIFTTSVGTAHDPDLLNRRALPRVLAVAELAPMRLYDLRHASATLMLASGVNAKVVQERLGHASIGMTLGTYGHVLPGQQREAADVLRRAVGR